MVCGCLVLAGCGGAQARRASHMERGERYLAEGNLQKAQIEFRNALQIEPNSAGTRVTIGRVDEQLGDFRAAAGMYQSAIDLDPDDVTARASLGRLYVLSGAADQALKLVQPALVKHPADASLLTVRGMARAALKDSGAARADAERAVQLAPNDENAVALLASIDVSDNAPKRAVDLVQAAVARLPHSAVLRQILADLYARLGEPQLAEAQLERIVALRPKDLAARYRLALFYARAKRLDDADRVFRETITVRPSEDGAKLAYVQFLLQYRSAADADHVLEDFLGRDPSDDDLRLALGAVQQREGDLREALTTYQHVVADSGEKPRGLTARDRIAAVELTQGRTDDAARLIAAVLQDNPRDDEALLLRANIAMQRHDPGTAIVDLRAVLHDQPRSVQLTQALARAYQANGQAALAEETFRAALDTAPGNPALVGGIAALYESEGRVDDAIRAYEALYQRDPQLPFAANNLAMLLVTYKKDRGSLDRAASLTARFLSSENPDLLDTAAWVCLKRGEIAKALSALQKAVERAPNSRVIRYHLGMAQLDAGQRDQARSSLEAALAGSARFEGWQDARSALASLEPRAAG